MSVHKVLAELISLWGNSVDRSYHGYLIELVHTEVDVYARLTVEQYSVMHHTLWSNLTLKLSGYR